MTIFMQQLLYVVPREEDDEAERNKKPNVSVSRNEKETADTVVAE